MTRILFDLLFLLCVAFLPWWAVLIVGAVGLSVFSSFYEMLIAGIIIDSLYAPAGARPYGIQCVASAVAAILFVSAEVLKRRLRFYAKGNLRL